ncbi:MAG: type II secretion system F family protein [Anaerolineae bacterium]|jgi:tight adherence protein C
MGIPLAIQNAELLWSPLAFAVLVGLSIALLWLAITPSRGLRLVGRRLDDYVETKDVVQELELRQPFFKRALLPVARGAVRWLGRRTPVGIVENTQHQLIRAGEPWGMTALDFLGISVLLPLGLGVGYFFVLGDRMPFYVGLRNTLILAALGLLLPRIWLLQRVRGRQREIERALPDALDMLSIGVEAGLAFESALLRVAEQWDNALTAEFRSAVREIRLGEAREEALRRMATRTGVESLATFVSVLLQSTRLGVSIAEVLHTQAAQMRLTRRQQAEERARQAGIKMVFPLVFLVFPAMLVVLLGPSAPALLGFLAGLAGGEVRVR